MKQCLENFANNDFVLFVLLWSTLAIASGEGVRYDLSPI